MIGKNPVVAIRYATTIRNVYDLDVIDDAGRRPTARVRRSAAGENGPRSQASPLSSPPRSSQHFEVDMFPAWPTSPSTVHSSRCESAIVHTPFLPRLPKRPARSTLAVGITRYLAVPADSEPSCRARLRPLFELTGPGQTLLDAPSTTHPRQNPLLRRAARDLGTRTESHRVPPIGATVHSIRIHL